MIPQWLCAQEAYSPCPDRDRFIDRSIRGLLRVLSRIRSRGADPRGRVDRINPGIRLASTLVFVLLLSLSRSPSYLGLSAAILLCVLSLESGDRILRVLKTCIPVAAFTLLIMLPSALWGNLSGALVITAKVLLCVAAVNLFAESVEWGATARALSVFHVPGIFLLVLDVTLRYIGLLGELSLSMLYALKLRSVGRNPDKTASLSGIAGTLFLKSRRMAEDVFAAMECRCFTGSYRTGPAPGLSAWDAAPLAVDAVLIAASVFLGA